MKKLSYLIIAFFTILLAGTNLKAQTISSHTETNDTCSTVGFIVSSTGCTSGQTVKIYFGDGTSAVSTAYCSGSSGSAIFSHAYSASGSYTIKEVLSDATGGLDSVTFTTTVSFCSNLHVRLYLDVNGNCIKDAGEPNLCIPVTVAIDSAGYPIDTVTMTAGISYFTRGIPGTVYGFRLVSPPAGLSLTCPSSGVIHSTILSSGMLASVEYFGFQCVTSSSFDLKMYAAFWPALGGLLANTAGVTVNNSSCTGTPAVVNFEFSPKYSFGWVSPPSLSYTVTGTSVSVDVGTVGAFTPKSFSVGLIPVSALTIGDTVNSTFTVTPITGDSNPTNNVIIRCDTVRAAFDPNRKSVTPTGDIAAGTKLEYLLEFENDGNDTAYNIHIMDTLSEYLDINTFQMGGGTHAVDIIKYVGAGKNILKFDFPDIRLPDSTHHDYCRGSVAFSINAKSTLSPGTTIANRVGIYFDTNPVVMTNTAYSRIPLPTGVKNNVALTRVKIYPNPVREELTIKTDAGSYQSMTIYNIIGQMILSEKVNQAATKIDVHALNPGIYYLSLKGTNGAKTIKFEKQ